MEKTNARARNSARRYSNKDDQSVVEIDLQIIIDRYSEHVEHLEKQFKKNCVPFLSCCTISSEIRLVLDLLTSQGLWENQYFKQLEALRDRIDEIDRKASFCKG
nr:hypothetical protein [uncultured Kingella sp.]